MQPNQHEAWLNYQLESHTAGKYKLQYMPCLQNIFSAKQDQLIHVAIQEITYFLGFPPQRWDRAPQNQAYLQISTDINLKNNDGFIISKEDSGRVIKIQSASTKGILYGVFHLLRALQSAKEENEIFSTFSPATPLRMINHWDNLDGTIERGYAGDSIFFQENQIIGDLQSHTQYARLMASVGINAVAINNVNVHKQETYLIQERYLKDMLYLAEVFRRYGIRLYLSVNYSAPMETGALDTADPLEPAVLNWWRKAAELLYSYIPDFGGYIVKADSENRPGPFTYGRNHADGANMLARSLEPYGGLVVWRCFVYDCHLDWRNRNIDRAAAAYEHFQPLDGQFAKNVFLQIKNGPMDFQIREPVSPLLGSMANTNQILEFQITQEYTGQQIHNCFLPPLWKEVLDFPTWLNGDEPRCIQEILQAKEPNTPHTYGIAAVSNIGNSFFWTGHPLAQANLYGYGRLCWDHGISAEKIAQEWISQTLGNSPKVLDTVLPVLLHSRETYEKYTAPLGIGWMCNVQHHYGPNMEGYEYSPWGTYHYANQKSIGVDRTIATGTKYISQYSPKNQSMYEDLRTCPEELLLFFHNVSYDYQLQSGKTLLQYIYDTHFEGVEDVEAMLESWQELSGEIEGNLYQEVLRRLEMQLASAIEWRDVVNTYFYRTTMIPDQHRRKIYP